MTQWLPDDAVHMIVDWHRTTCPGRDWTGHYSEEITACLAPFYARAGYVHEAMAMTRTAHHEKAQALAGIARYLPDPDQMATAREALALARSTGSERVRTDYMRQFTEVLMKLAGATRVEDIVSDSPDAWTLATVAQLLPPGEAAEVWEETIAVMSGSELRDFVTVMPDDVARDAIVSIAGRLADDYAGRQASIIQAIFARIGESSPSAQFERLVDFMAASAELGRPILLRQLGVVAPLLHELGGDEALNGLRQAVFRVAAWWP